MSTSSDFDQAAQRVEEKLDFYTHLAVYFAVNAGLAVLDYLTSPDDVWFYWPLAGWGIGVVWHAWKVFSTPAISRTKLRMIQRVH